MSERPNFTAKESNPEIGFDIATTVTLQDKTELLLGHTLLGDFRLQTAPTPEVPRPHQLQAYHSVEPAILAHVVWQLTRNYPPEHRQDVVNEILAREEAIVVGELRYPGRNMDQESIDRQYEKTSSRFYRLLANDDEAQTPSLPIGHEGSLEGRLYHHPDGILITDEQWDDDAEFVIDEEDEDNFQLEDFPRKEIEVVNISNDDLPAFAAALVATARTDYGRVKHSDMIATLRTALPTPEQ